MTATATAWGFDNTYARELEGFYVPWQPARVPAPRLLALNESLAVELGLDPDWLRTEDGIAHLVGNRVPNDATPLAQAYSGHQFGSFSPVLGDGRALLLGELIDTAGRRRDVGLKGSGATPFARGGDGKAVIGPVLREYVVGEAMHALGIPTTRALAAVATGEAVRRNRPEPGAVLVRVAASHLRVGTFELLATRGTHEQLRQLADYAVARHLPDALEVSGAERYRLLLEGVVARQAELVAAWMSVGFIHGVMNTDNMTISGETIDYGPCAFLEGYDDRAVYSSIDAGGRYAFGHQPAIAVWNLSRLAEALLPLLAPSAATGGAADEAGAAADEAVEIATAAVEGFAPRYQAAWLARMSAKLGLAKAGVDLEVAVGAVDLLRAAPGAPKIDHTLWWRSLAAGIRGADAADPARETVLAAGTASASAYDEWRGRWLAALGERDRSMVADAMDAVNPLYVPRNHLVERALAAASGGDDLEPLHVLVDAVTHPFVERPDDGELAAPAPSGFDATYVTYCGT